KPTLSIGPYHPSVYLVREEWPSALGRGWSGKLFGYGVQVGCRIGLYEYFKKFYSDVLVDQNKSIIFFVSSASAQIFANVALCPLEVVKVRVQAQPNFAKCLLDVSMMIFSTFEHTVDLIYSEVIQRQKEDCSRAQQLGVTCLAGNAAGAVCL
ncbi:hypothetical protein RJ641_019690, partial [Dillenia turbinata]